MQRECCSRWEPQAPELPRRAGSEQQASSLPEKQHRHKEAMVAHGNTAADHLRMHPLPSQAVLSL